MLTMVLVAVVCVAAELFLIRFLIALIAESRNSVRLSATVVHQLRSQTRQNYSVLASGAARTKPNQYQGASVVPITASDAHRILNAGR